MISYQVPSITVFQHICRWLWQLHCSPSQHHTLLGMLSSQRSIWNMHLERITFIWFPLQIYFWCLFCRPPPTPERNCSLFHYKQQVRSYTYTFLIKSGNILRQPLFKFPPFWSVIDKALREHFQSQGLQCVLCIPSSTHAFPLYSPAPSCLSQTGRAPVSGELKLRYVNVGFYYS